MLIDARIKSVMIMLVVEFTTWIHTVFTCTSHVGLCRMIHGQLYWFQLVIYILPIAICGSQVHVARLNTSFSAINIHAYQKPVDSTVTATNIIVSYIAI